MKRTLAAALALLQVILSLGPGAIDAFAQQVTVQVQTPAGVPVGVAAAGSGISAVPGGAANPATLSQPILLLPSQIAPVTTIGAPISLSAARTPGSPAQAAAAQARTATAGEDTSLPLAAFRTSPKATGASVAQAAQAKVQLPAAARVIERTAAAGRAVAADLQTLRAPAAQMPGESARGLADGAFNALYGEKLIRGTGEVSEPGVRASEPGIAAEQRESPSRRIPGLQAASPSTAVRSEPGVPAAPTLPPSAGARVRTAAIAVATVLAAAGAVPFLIPHAAVIGAIGSVALSVIGIPQIIHNFRGGREGVKDLVIASPLIWFSAASLLSIASIGHGSSLAWNAANVAGVLESATVVGQINAYKRDKSDLKATLMTVAATAVPVALAALQVFMPLKAWADLAFTAAMGLLWVLNWPQIKQNYNLFKTEGRAPSGIAPAYPALVAGGSLLHLLAALAAGDMRWAMNAIIAIVTAGAVLAQIYAPRAANAVIGPLARLQDGAAALIARARTPNLIEDAFSGADLSRFAGEDGDAALAEAEAKAKAMPGRSVIFLEAPTSAGKSTLAKSLAAALGKRIRSIEVDRYFKSVADVRPRHGHLDHPLRLGRVHAAGRRRGADRRLHLRLPPAAQGRDRGPPDDESLSRRARGRAAGAPSGARQERARKAGGREPERLVADPGRRARQHPADALPSRHGAEPGEGRGAAEPSRSLRPPARRGKPRDARGDRPPHGRHDPRLAHRRRGAVSPRRAARSLLGHRD
ncbi:MAG: hypothetical protein NTX64_12930 [Elusimicrobia bacterium]|nr:hypothetical protein [Elusimicrobiota bacterium]